MEKGIRLAMEDPVPGTMNITNLPTRDTRMHTEMVKEPCPGSLNWEDETAGHLLLWPGVEAAKTSTKK